MSIPEALPRNRSLRAIERFFINWISITCGYAISIGRELDLPILYSAIPAESLLLLAVDTIALAHVSYFVSRRLSEPQGALRRYGEALNVLCELAYDNRAFVSVEVIAGILLLNAFELYLSFPTPKPSAVVLIDLSIRLFILGALILWVLIALPLFTVSAKERTRYSTMSSGFRSCERRIDVFKVDNFY